MSDTPIDQWPPDSDHDDQNQQGDAPDSFGGRSEQGDQPEHSGQGGPVPSDQPDPEANPEADPLAPLDPIYHQQLPPSETSGTPGQILPPPPVTQIPLEPQVPPAPTAPSAHYQQQNQQVPPPAAQPPSPDQRWGQSPADQSGYQQAPPPPPPPPHPVQPGQWQYPQYQQPPAGQGYGAPPTPPPAYPPAPSPPGPPQWPNQGASGGGGVYPPQGGYPQAGYPTAPGAPQGQYPYQGYPPYPGYGQTPYGQAPYGYGYQAPAPQPKGPVGWDRRKATFPAALWITWGALAALVIGLVILQSVRTEPKPLVTPDPAKMPNPMLRFMSRYVVGVDQMIGQQSQFGTANELISQLEQYVQGPQDEIRLIAVVAEVEGTSAALDRLNFILDDPTIDTGFRRDAQVMRTIYQNGASKLDSASSERLIKRHNWFGRLALSYGLKNSNPLRQNVLSAGTRTILLLVAFVGFIGLADIAGIVLFITAIILLFSRKLKSGYMAQEHESNGPPSVYLETAFIFLLGLSGVMLLPVLIDASGWKIPNWAGMVLPWLALPLPFWPLLRGVSFAEWKKAMGINRGRGIWREAGAGVLGYFAGLPVLIIGLIISLILIAIATAIQGMGQIDPVTHPAAEQFPRLNGFWQMLGMFMMLCVWAPLLEELAFRGAFYHHMRRRWGPILSTLVVAFVFAVIHPQGVLFVPVLMAIATTLSFLREWRGSLIAPMVMHACNNAVAFFAMCMMFT